ncbi:hypothetical protein QQF64_035501 [Cirrhinus molitorella]|uniref:Uncharacterized protein n=1 Tax=Cirrhinus molitorella TaxID=172907 RepID=A0ABR3NG02_9TELE
MRVVGTPNPHPFKPQAFWNDLMLAERAQLASSTRLRLKDAGRVWDFPEVTACCMQGAHSKPSSIKQRPLLARARVELCSQNLPTMRTQRLSD